MFQPKEELVKLDAQHTRLPGILSLALVLGLALAAVARADGGGGGGGGNSNVPDSQKCGKGDYFSDKTGKCEKLKSGALADVDLAQYAAALSRAKRYSEALDVFETMRHPELTVSLLPDADLPEYAITLAKAKRYNEALAVLDKIKNSYTPVALNYRGYVTRHLGRLDRGIQYYYQSIRLDPHYAQVREYLGEAYVIKGDLVKAKFQLSMIKWICGDTACDEYKDLENAIAGHPEED
jgi:tetratricopeptide (TPR) repeat protein